MVQDGCPHKVKFVRRLKSIRDACQADKSKHRRLHVYMRPMCGHAMGILPTLQIYYVIRVYIFQSMIVINVHPDGMEIYHHTPPAYFFGAYRLRV
jgi:hypothetical protein